MSMIEACRVELSPRFGTSIYRHISAHEEALHWLEKTLAGQCYQKNVRVQGCKAPQLEETGIKRIDAMMMETGGRDGFMTGNVSSNMQSSTMLPAFSSCTVNGFTTIDGRDLTPGYLQAQAFKPMLQSKWNDEHDREALLQIQNVLKEVQPDRGTTLYRIMHMRSKDTRYQGPSPVHTHGWLLIDDRDQLHYEKRIGNSAAGQSLFMRAKQVLTHQHTDAQTILEVKDGRFTFVDPEVMKAFLMLEPSRTATEVMAFNVPTPYWAMNEVDSLEAQEPAKDQMAS